MWWQPLSLQSCQSQPFLRNSFSTVWHPLIMCQWRGLTVRECNLLGMVMSPSAMDMTRGTITLLKFLYSTIYIYIYMYVCVCVCVCELQNTPLKFRVWILHPEVSKFYYIYIFSVWVFKILEHFINFFHTF